MAEAEVVSVHPRDGERGEDWFTVRDVASGRERSAERSQLRLAATVGSGSLSVGIENIARHMSESLSRSSCVCVWRAFQSLSLSLSLFCCFLFCCSVVTLSRSSCVARSPSRAVAPVSPPVSPPAPPACEGTTTDISRISHCFF